MHLTYRSRGLNDLLMELRQAHGNLVTSVILGNLVPAPSSPGETVQEWIDSGLDEQELRRAMSRALKDQRWLKRVDHGERLARVVEAHWGLARQRNEVDDREV